MSERDKTGLSYAVIFVAAVVALLLLYPQIWSISPSRDDYRPPMAEVHRGMSDGPWSLFTEPSSFPFYRPLTFVSYWLAGAVAMEELVPIVHGLHFFWVAACVGVLALWARTLEFSRFAFAFTAVVFVTHPALAGPLASIDGFQRVAATAWTWLGAWFILRSARGSLGGDLAAAGCLALGLGFAEYALGLMPLALLAALWRRQTGRSWASIARLALLLGIVVLVWYEIRAGIIGPRSTAFASLHLSRWLANVGQLLAVTLFWGNSVWTMLGPQPWAMVGTAGAIVLALLWLGGGLYGWHSAQQGPRTLGVSPTRGDTGLLLIATLAVTFPMVIMHHVSEMYATPVLMSVALLAGKAAQGWLPAALTLRRLAFAGAALAVVVGVWASWAKIEGVAAAGRRSDEQIRQILSHIPQDARHWRIATVFDAVRPEPKYSVFAPWESDLEVVRTDTLAWFRPRQELQLESMVLPAACARDDVNFDLILQWDRAAARYDPLDHEDFRARCDSR